MCYSLFDVGICREVCSECVKEFLEKLKALQVAICTSGHNGFYDGFLWTREVTDRHVQEANQRHHQVAIVRPLPLNISMMRQKGFHYKFRHSYYNCKYRSLGCYHPHGEEEDTQWNAWRTGTEGWTPVKLHDHAVGQYQRSEQLQCSKLSLICCEMFFGKDLSNLVDITGCMLHWYQEIVVDLKI